MTNNDALVGELREQLDRYGLVITDDPDFDHNDESFDKALASFAAALRTPQPEVVDEKGWLIELPLTASAGGRLCWVALEDGPFPLFRTLNHCEDYDFQKIASPLRFTPESNEALRFARKVDAENFMAKFDRYLLHAIVIEHAWTEAARQALHNANLSATAADVLRLARRET